MIDKQYGKLSLVCDNCGEGEKGFESHSGLMSYIKDEGWKIKRIDNEWGHKNGQIELIRRILNISEGVSHKPEQALKGGAAK